MQVQSFGQLVPIKMETSVCLNAEKAFEKERALEYGLNFDHVTVLLQLIDLISRVAQQLNSLVVKHRDQLRS
jgi:hypothetical protein